MPASAPCSTTAADSAPSAVEPQPSLMFRPSGSSPIVMTSAPARRSACGAIRYAAPCAQSATTRSPASGGCGCSGGPAPGGSRVPQEEPWPPPAALTPPETPHRRRPGAGLAGGVLAGDGLAAEYGGRGHAEVQGQARGQLITGDPADPIRTEQPATLPRFSHLAPHPLPSPRLCWLAALVRVLI